MRTLLLLALGYMIWVIVRTVSRIWSADRKKERGYGTVHGDHRRAEHPEKPFSDIKDAEFEELDRDKRKES